MGVKKELIFCTPCEYDPLGEILTALAKAAIHQEALQRRCMCKKIEACSLNFKSLQSFLKTIMT